MSSVLIIGGGFFGMYIAEYFALAGKKVLLFEKEGDFMQRASYVNQARVHNGYHYPRSILTASRSRISFPRFCKEFEDCIDDSFEKYYMVGKLLGKITAKQFEQFCTRIGAPCDPASHKITKLINPHFIEAAYLTLEYAFDAVRLKKIMQERLADAGVICSLNTIVESVRQGDTGLEVEVRGVNGNEYRETIGAEQVFNCTYSMLNYILNGSGIDIIPLKHEITEMCLVEVPDELKKTGITVMCGPFFSVMPFPAEGCHSFSHVRYTPHYEWYDHSGKELENSQNRFSGYQKKTAWKQMLFDAKKYMPVLEKCKYIKSIWEVKTVLPRSESDDSRPILFKENYGLKGFHCVMGGKIDNIYDVTAFIEEIGLCR